MITANFHQICHALQINFAINFFVKSICLVRSFWSTRLPFNHSTSSKPLVDFSILPFLPRVLTNGLARRPNKTDEFDENGNFSENGKLEEILPKLSNPLNMLEPYPLKHLCTHDLKTRKVHIITAHNLSEISSNFLLSPNSPNLTKSF